MGEKQRGEGRGEREDSGKVVGGSRSAMGERPKETEYVRERYSRVGRREK